MGVLKVIRRVVPFNIDVSESTEQKDGREGLMLGLRGNFIVWNKVVTIEVGYMI